MRNKQTPDIRFAGFSGNWEERKLGDLAEFLKGNGYAKSDLTDEGKPIILYGRLYTKYETVIESVDTYTIEKEKSVISKGNEVIVPASGETSEDISRASVVSEPGIILGGDLNIVRPSDEIEPVFLALTISNGKQQKELTKRAQGKSVVHLHNSDLKEVNLLFPKKEEQTQIGNFFKQLDDIIALQQQELDTLKQTKQGFMQKMFPKEGESVPEVRFPGFTGDWEQRKLGEVFSYKQGQQIPVEDQYFENTGDLKRFIRIVDLTSINEPERFINYDGNNVVKTDDLFMIRYGQPGIVGYGYTGVIANNLFRLIPKIETVNLFYKYIFEFIYPQIKSLSSSTTMPALSFKSMDVLELKIPGIDEQQKIGKFFKQLDDTIALHQRELDALKETKKAFLQKMFV